MSPLWPQQRRARTPRHQVEFDPSEFHQLALCSAAAEFLHRRSAPMTMTQTRAAVLAAFAQHRASAILRTNDRAAVRLGSPSGWSITVTNVSTTGQADGGLSLEFPSQK